MLSEGRVTEVATALLQSSGLELVSLEPLQTLWAGYGHIWSLKASSAQTPNSETRSLILKYVSPPTRRSSKKSQDEGHLRKVISYQVEQYFYAHLAPLMPKGINVAQCFGSISADSTTAMILSDLRGAFPTAAGKRGDLSENQVHAAVSWLANFHGFWWRRAEIIPRANLRLPPLEEAQRSTSGGASGVWLNGGYTYLATRRTEYAGLVADSGSEWSDRLCVPAKSDQKPIAERVARFLSPRRDGIAAISGYETLIHGDVKSENLFTTEHGDDVAFFDFQYIGIGLGVCDLAKLFTCSVPLEMLAADVNEGRMQPGEEALLRRYMTELHTMSGKQYGWDVLKRHWETALVDWLRFQASWGFWGNTEWLEARVRSVLEDQEWTNWLDEKSSFE